VYMQDVSSSVLTRFPSVSKGLATIREFSSISVITHSYIHLIVDIQATILWHVNLLCSLLYFCILGLSNLGQACYWCDTCTHSELRDMQSVKLLVHVRSSQCSFGNPWRFIILFQFGNMTFSLIKWKTIAWIGSYIILESSSIVQDYYFYFMSVICYH
jgi:hypothetical protein